jgi:hypothetical protein
MIDDRPVWLTTAAGPILGLPYTLTLNDVTTYQIRLQADGALADRTLRTLERHASRVPKTPWSCRSVCTAHRRRPHRIGEIETDRRGRGRRARCSRPDLVADPRLVRRPGACAVTAALRPWTGMPRTIWRPRRGCSPTWSRGCGVHPRRRRRWRGRRRARHGSAGRDAGRGQGDHRCRRNAVTLGSGVFAGRIAAEDAEPVARPARAGAVILA